MHAKHIPKEGELEHEASDANFATVQMEGKREITKQFALSIYRSGKMSNMRIYNRDREVLYDMRQTPDISRK